MGRFTRRAALGLLSGSAFAASACATCRGFDPETAIPLGTETSALKDLAAAKGIRFGSAMASYQVDDPRELSE